MQEGDKEEELPLYYQVPLPRLLSWNRWWHIVRQSASTCISEEILGITRQLSNPAPK